MGTFAFSYMCVSYLYLLHREAEGGSLSEVGMGEWIKYSTSEEEEKEALEGKGEVGPTHLYHPRGKSRRGEEEWLDLRRCQKKKIEAHIYPLGFPLLHPCRHLKTSSHFQLVYRFECTAGVEGWGWPLSKVLYLHCRVENHSPPIISGVRSNCFPWWFAQPRA